jgi:hypothetical protein
MRALAFFVNPLSNMISSTLLTFRPRRPNHIPPDATFTPTTNLVPFLNPFSKLSRSHLLGTTWGPLGKLLGVSWGGLGTSWGALGALGRPPGELLGCSWDLSRFCGLSWGPLGARLGPTEVLLKLISKTYMGRRVLLGHSWGVLGAQSGQKPPNTLRL